MKTNEKGITLIALVVTIIVLLILAGISIGVLTGNNGIINQAQNAKDDTQYQQWSEQIDVAIIDAESKNRNPTMDNVIDELINKGIISDESQVDKKTGDITTNEPSYVIEDKLNDYIPFGPGMIADKNETYTDTNGDTATIPKGFEILEEASTVDDGLVVQDEEGNQFVWIPVDDINSMSQCSTAGGSCNLELQGDGTLKCTTHSSTEIVGKLYETSLIGGHYFGTVNTTYNENRGLREPAILTGENINSGVEYFYDVYYCSKLGYDSVEEMLNGLKKQYEEMATSVAKNKGFYVGRYELGLEGTAPVSKNASTNTNVSTAGANYSNTYMWYGLYNKCKEFATKESDKSVVSSMIWGSQYDAMMNWMQDQGEDVTSVDSSKINIYSITGYNPNDVIKNIFDLYGCKDEFTLEAYDTGSRIIRGGTAAFHYSPSYRSSSNAEFTNHDDSSRISLYVK